MAGPTELPQLIGEFLDMARQYMRQQLVEPARGLGRLFGMGAAASILLSLGALFLAVVGLRIIVEALPDGVIWSGFGYILASFALLAATGLVMWRASK